MKKFITLVMTIAIISALAITTSAAEMPTDYIAYFTFDDAEAGLAGGGAVATPNNVAADGTAEVVIDTDNAFKGGALSLDNTSEAPYWLEVAKEDGSSLLTGYNELTISFWSNYTGTANGWSFFAVPVIDGAPYTQVYLSEKYIGALENTTSLTVERYLCDGARTTSLSGMGYEGEWQMYTVTFTDTSFTLYQDGEVWTYYDTCAETLADILGEESNFYIGTATWGGLGNELYGGYIDEFVVYPYAMNDEQVANLYAAQSGEEAPIETEAPETEAPETEAPETEAPETEAPKGDDTTAAPEEEKGGCGSAMGAAAAIVALTSVLGCAIIKKH